jgi:hypothetical protein
MITSGSVLFLGKGDPSPTNRLNPFVKIDSKTGNFLENPELKKVLTDTERALKSFYLPER